MSTSKFSTYEIVAISFSVVVLLVGIVYWLQQAGAVIDLLQLAYEYSIVGIMGRFLLALTGIVILIAAVTFIHKVTNKKH